MCDSLKSSPHHPYAKLSHFFVMYKKDAIFSSQLILIKEYPSHFTVLFITKAKITKFFKI